MKNNLLSEKLVYNGKDVVRTRMTAVKYSSSSCLDTEITDIASLPEAGNDEILWLRVRGLADTALIEELCLHYGIDFLTVQDILNIHHKSKVDIHDTYVFIVSKIYVRACPGGEVCKERIRLILTGNVVISFSDRDSSFFDDVSSALHKDVLKIRRRFPFYLMSVLVNEMLYDYMSEAVRISDALEEIEDGLLTLTSDRDTGTDIQKLRHRYLNLKHTVTPLKEQFPMLVRSDLGLVGHDDMPFYRDVYDHLLSAMQEIDECRETLASLMDLYISNNGLRMNDIMRKLTIVSTIFIPMTFLAGVWGMNFTHMPELKSPYGYISAWGLFIVSGIACYFIFRTKKWG